MAQQFPSQCICGKLLSNNGPGEGRRKAPFTPRPGLLSAPPSPHPAASVATFPASLPRFVCWTEVVTLHIPLGERKGGWRVAQGLGRGSQGNRMNLFSEKHGVQTGRFLLSCFSSVKASINSTLIIKSEQCVSGFQQLNSVTAVSLGSLASFTT